MHALPTNLTTRSSAWLCTLATLLPPAALALAGCGGTALQAGAGRGAEAPPSLDDAAAMPVRAGRGTDAR